MRRLVILSFIWGWSFLFIKVAVRGLTPTTVAAGRVGLGMVVLVLVLRRSRQPLPRDVTSWRHFAVMGVLQTAVPFSLLAWGEQHVSSALAAVLNASTPLFAALFVFVLLRERLRPFQLVGLVLGFVGVAVAAGLGGADLARSSLGGEAAAVAAAACYGLAFAYAQRHLVTTPPLVAASGQLIVGTAVLLPVAVATSLQRGVHVTPTRVAAVVLLGVFGTGIAFVLNYRSINDLGPTRASMVTYLVPVVAVTVGVVFLGEAFQLRLVAGGVLTVLGIAMLHGRLSRATTAPLAADA